ncbi:sigma-54-dependent transcriptional regulator [Pelodictyon phaeoclathratiforme]|jgi:DNA-binding NtrC family response regulator|uniref:Response regulator receiver protein n=1 Tax=Pelodictyon phaeoclathratiforme (strain DSM 5477 / BU-1) TaxID=324925 RepID=B4SB65_PELPB|nr:sigma 54-interacting transcriptional regulator [Pelodictyon phaeoclathratiforme]ACF42486.1 response regulator receiver protein [Pelodictyon phaeoclathratiforme BU-1]MBV5327442.1 sigma-54-dependent Fis family transcriptional regulator [Chlorobium sp.]
MIKLPRVLIIDDQYGRSHYSGDGMHPRTSFCILAGMKDVTGDIPFPETLGSPIVEALFFRGQIEKNGVVYNDLDGTIDAIRKGWKEWPRWAMVMLDLQFITGQVRPEGTVEGCDTDRDPSSYFGLSILDRIRSEPDLHDIPVVLLSSMNRTPIEKRFADYSVCQFLDKDEIDRHYGRERIATLLKDHGLVEDPSGEIIGHSVTLLKCLREARMQARAGGKNILILGERGTGKELLARYMHKHSGRSGELEMCFLQGCPETLVEDLLFGHVKGAYSGASADQAGAAERADKGTLFIDEFGAIPPSVQTKLLRLLGSTREVQRMGSSKKRIVDLLVVLATNRMNLQVTGDFHMDLLDRINVEHSVKLPALRERIEDIPALLEHFVSSYEAKYRDALQTEPRNIDPEAIAQMMAYPWYGNIRQLEAVVAHAVNRFPKLRILSVSHLSIPQELTEKPVVSSPVKSDGGNFRLIFSEILSQLETITFDTSPEKRGELVEALPKLKAAYSTCAANMIRSALIATSKHNPGHPMGQIQITPAVNLLFGNKKLSASQCADEIKRLFRYSPKSVQQYWSSDSVLTEAYNIAVNLRPKQGDSNQRGS